MNLHQETLSCKPLIGKKAVACVLSGVLLLGGFSPAFASQPISDEESTVSQSTENYKDLEELLYFIEQIPEEAFESDEKYYHYINENLPSSSKINPSAVSLMGLSIEDDVNGLGCFTAAGAAIIGLSPLQRYLKSVQLLSQLEAWELS